MWNQWFTKVPHITYALTEGTKPSYSKELILKSALILFETPINVNGISFRKY